MNTKNWMVAVFLLMLGTLLGVGMSRLDHAAMTGDGPLAQSGGACADGTNPSYWVAPMDPDFRADTPGKSPMGMDLIPVCADADLGDDADVVISAQVEQNLGVRTAILERRSLQRPVAAVGTVGYDESSFQMIHSRAEGWIEKLGVESDGAAVTGGSELYALFAPKLVAAASEYQTALGSGREWLIAAARERLLALGYDESQIRKLRQNDSPGNRLSQRAASDAVVAMLGVREGQFVMPGTHIMTLASLQRVWVLADVLERDAALIHVGQPTRVTLAGWPGRDWIGQVDYIYPSLDPRTRTLKVRVVMDNADEVLRPNMFTRVTIDTADHKKVLVAPASALIRSGRGDRVVVALGEGRFRVVPVSVGLIAQGQVQILEGLQDGDHVVIDGQFLIDSEANVDAEARRLEGAVPSMPGMSDLKHDMSHDMANMSAEQHHTAASTASLTQGTVVDIDFEQGFITLDHAYIQSIDMPGMVMSFLLDESLDLKGYKVGDVVRFAAIQQDGEFRLSHVEHAQ
jgi:Cu(I)/Ag(I) efflux system membrane fusion protein